MKAPRDPNDLLRTLHDEATVLDSADEATLRHMIAQIRAGKHAVIIIENEPDKLLYMFATGNRPRAIQMMGTVIESTAKKLRDV
jgi:hypothetical protein